MSNNTQDSPVAQGQRARRPSSKPTPAKVDVAKVVKVSNPRAAARLGGLKLGPGDRILEGPHKGKRPSELAMEMAAENRRTVQLAQAQMARDLRAMAGRLTNRREQLAKQRAGFDRMVAQAVSSKPTAPDWYEHPGPLPRATVLEETGLSTVALHRLMERYRKTATAPRPRRKPARR